ncbi:hypothetical protein F5887DRAFT_1177857 [Amanita rubescens]|nr:hypothetical protein F5887DRAFT_1177857 [Amanita rubescens]
MAATIVVNKHTIQVERYLSQGGFAHVYLVRTATPVHNTTHHVLKRIAVPDQSMLAEVKKEVDIMRLLKGHPNIVHFIDAAWHKTPNGMFEVFILMEYCPGGGIIDMMNRRLRERLTEAEILQIFVDVCEAVAYMHNLRPPLLHRDLKVENILQSSQSSYKLCDFGSATGISRPPSNIQELRLLEADLNKHTTMQYRAPEMVDVHMRRPIDEKSDVWALGVLLYKLCYYTTPFEEHGPLAILQVSYRIPPYPVYSPQMNALIDQQVFEVLSEVHRMRGTKSQFQYAVVVPQPLSPSRPPHTKHATLSALDGVIAYRSPKTPHKQQTGTPSSPAKNQGQLARDKVMEAIAPMRRGRPSPSKDLSRPSSRQSSPQKTSNVTGDKLKLNLNGTNVVDDERAWKSLIAETKQSKPSSLIDSDAWVVVNEKENVQRSAPIGFNDNFTEKLRPSAESYTPHVGSKQTPKSAGFLPSQSRESAIPTRHAPPPQSAINIISRKSRTEKDAFDGLGLGLPTEKPEPTLGEARKLRTGLAIISSTRPKLESENRPSGSPRPSYLTPQPYFQTQAFLSTSPSNASSASSTAQIASRPPSSTHIDGMPIESRFPSLEELDASFPTSVKSQNSTRPTMSAKSTNISKQVTPATLHEKSLSDASIKPTEKLMQEKQGSSHTHIFQFADDSGDSLRLDKGKALPSTMVDNATPRRVSSLSLKPTIARRQRTSISFKRKTSTDDDDTVPSQLPPSVRHEVQLHPRTPPSKLASQPRDWLTGDDNLFSPSTPSHMANSDMPILRRSPSKHASVTEKSDIFIPEAAVVEPEHTSAIYESTSDIEVSPTIAKFSRQFPPIENGRKNLLSDAWDASVGKGGANSSSSSADEGPEDANGVPAAVKSGSLTKQSRRRTRQSSIHDSVDLWGGAAQHNKHAEQMNEEEEKPVPRSKQRTTGRLSPLIPPLTLIPSSNSAEHSSYLDPIAISNDRKQSLSSGGISPSSSRPRPQSLLLPSRSAEGSSQKTSLLEAPIEVKRRQNVRRTSITDMVEKYEAMGGNAKHIELGSRPPSPLIIRKSPSSKSAPQVMERDRSLGSVDIGASLAVPPSPTTPSRQRTSPTRMTRANAGITTSPGDRRMYYDSPKPSETPEGRKSNVLENMAPRIRKLSLKPLENLKPPVSLQDLLAADDRKEKLNADRSPSPDRSSYQGVGRLIDQWQRKAEEAEPRPPGGGKRSSVIISKRPGTAGKG